MASCPHTIVIAADTGMLLLQLDCVQGVLRAKSRWEAEIELGALRALTEIRKSVDAARQELGLALPQRIDLGVIVTTPEGRRL